MDESIALFLTLQGAPQGGGLPHLSSPGGGKHTAAERLIEIVLTLWLRSGDPTLSRLCTSCPAHYFEGTVKKYIKDSLVPAFSSGAVGMEEGACCSCGRGSVGGKHVGFHSFPHGQDSCSYHPWIRRANPGLHPGKFQIRVNPEVPSPLMAPFSSPLLSLPGLWSWELCILPTFLPLSP